MLECVALHRLVVVPPARSQYIGAARPDRIEPAAAERLNTYIENLRERSEGAGRAQAAWWVDARPDAFNELLACDPDDFDMASRSAIDRLRDCTPPNAQSGVSGLRQDHG